MNRSLKIFITCALGAFVGSVVALELNHYLWWIGLLIGGLFGYLSYEFHKVRAAIGIAWKATFGQLGDREGRRLWALSWLGISAMYASFFILVGLLDWSTSWLPVKPTNKPLGVNYWSMVLFFLLYPIFASFFSMRQMNAEVMAKKMLKFANPITVYLYYPLRFGWWLIAALYTAVSKLVQGVPQFLLWCKQQPQQFRYAANLVVKFTKMVLVAVHSDVRLLCAVDAALGTGIGYFFQSPLIGALAGGLFGVLNYELVSRRWLHLPINQTSTS